MHRIVNSNAKRVYRAVWLGDFVFFNAESIGFYLFMHIQVLIVTDEIFLPVKHQLPKWEESVLATRARYELVIKDLADYYHTENLLLVTHGKILISFILNSWQRNLLIRISFF